MLQILFLMAVTQARTQGGSFKPPFYCSSQFSNEYILGSYLSTLNNKAAGFYNKAAGFCNNTAAQAIFRNMPVNEAIIMYQYLLLYAHCNIL